MLTIGSVVVAAFTCVGVGVAWARWHAPAPQAPVQVTLGSEPGAGVERPLPQPEAPTAEAPAPVTSTRAVLDAWEAEIAKAEARRSAELEAAAASVAAIEKQRRDEALRLPDNTVSLAHGGRPKAHVSNPPSTTDHPSWWQDDKPIPGRMRMSVAAQQRAMAAAGVAPYNVTSPSAWLPPNPGNTITTRTPGSQ